MVFKIDLGLNILKEGMCVGGGIFVLRDIIRFIGKVWFFLIELLYLWMFVIIFRVGLLVISLLFRNGFMVWKNDGVVLVFWVVCYISWFEKKLDLDNCI